MSYHCGWVGVILSALILIFVIWPTQIIPQMYSWWVVVISAALLLLHALTCKRCMGILSKRSGASSRSVRGKRKRR